MKDKKQDIKPVDNETVKDLSWDDIRVKKDETVKNLITMQLTNVELIKLLDQILQQPEADVPTDKDYKELSLKAVGINNTFIDIAEELKNVIDKYDIVNRQDNEDDENDWQIKLEALYALIDVDDKVMVVNGTGVLDLIAQMANKDSLKQDSENLKTMIKENLAKQPEEDTDGQK